MKRLLSKCCLFLLTVFSLLVSKNPSSAIAKDSNSFPEDRIVFPEFFIDVSGEKVPSAELGKKYVGLYFSASWCGPCRKFTPTLISFRDKFKNELIGFVYQDDKGVCKVFKADGKHHHDTDALSEESRKVLMLVSTNWLVSSLANKEQVVDYWMYHFENGLKKKKQDRVQLEESDKKFIRHIMTGIIDREETVPLRFRNSNYYQTFKNDVKAWVIGVALDTIAGKRQKQSLMESFSKGAFECGTEVKAFRRESNLYNPTESFPTNEPDLRNGASFSLKRNCATLFFENPTEYTIHKKCKMFPIILFDRVGLDVEVEFECEILLLNIKIEKMRVDPAPEDQLQLIKDQSISTVPASPVTADNFLEKIITLFGKGTKTDVLLNVPDSMYVMVPNHSGTSEAFKIDGIRWNVVDSRIYSERRLNFSEEWKVYKPGDFILNIEFESQTQKPINSSDKLCEQDDLLCPLIMEKQIDISKDERLRHLRGKLTIAANNGSFSLRDVFEKLVVRLQKLDDSQKQNIAPDVDAIDAKHPIVIMLFSNEGASVGTKHIRYNPHNPKSLADVFQEKIST